jgi:hypothetical protein
VRCLLPGPSSIGRSYMRKGSLCSPDAVKRTGFGTNTSQQLSSDDRMTFELPRRQRVVTWLPAAFRLSTRPDNRR